jgi:diguanylate cyclase (GGDEF)-like protein
MLHGLLRRLVIWTFLTTLPIVAASATVTHLVPSELTNVAPLVSALAILAAILGWSLLHREMQRRLRDGEEVAKQARRLHEAMHTSLDGLYLLRAVRTDSGELVDLAFSDVNEAGAALLKRTRADLLGRALRGDIGGAFAEQLFERYRWSVSTGSPIVEELRADRRLVRASWVLHQAMPTSDGLAVTARDITARKREEKTLRRASLTDDLTGLYNRRGFMAIAEQQLRMARRTGTDTVIMYVDMDGFKLLNDEHGHAVGDRALQLVGRLLRDTVRDSDVVARLGGDEFTILACEAEGGGARSIQRRIEARLARVNASGKFPAALQLTLGYTRVRPTDSAGVSELLARADELLYARKRRRHLAHRHDEPRDPSMPTVPRAPRRTPRVAPVAVPADVAAVAIAAARQLPNGQSGIRPLPAPAALPPLRLSPSS